MQAYEGNHIASGLNPVEVVKFGLAAGQADWRMPCTFLDRVADTCSNLPTQSPLDRHVTCCLCAPRKDTYSKYFGPQPSLRQLLISLFGCDYPTPQGRRIADTTLETHQLFNTAGDQS